MGEPSRDRTPVRGGDAEEGEAPREEAQDPITVCPGCSTTLIDHKCKLVCTGCGFYLSCSDFY